MAVGGAFPAGDVEGWGEGGSVQRDYQAEAGADENLGPKGTRELFYATKA